MIYPVILAGGVGRRLQPLSTPEHPKQFHALQSDKPIMIETINRVQSNIFHPPVIISHQSYELKIRKLCEDYHVHSYDLILEPSQKNTCPAIMLAVTHIAKRDPNALILILPTDHFVDSVTQFQNDIQDAANACDDDHLVIFGSPTLTAETEYGYIQTYLGDLEKIIQFTEKPNLETAQTYVIDPQYFWNCGIVMGRATAFLNHMRKFQPKMLSHIEKGNDFNDLENISFDNAILEQSSDILVKKISFEWYDMGHWKNIS